MSPEEAAYKILLEVTETLGECGEFVLVGGWVPELHFPRRGHAGSIDVDIVLAPDAVDDEFDLHEFLRSHRYERSKEPTPTRYLRPVSGFDAVVAVDLLTTPSHRGQPIKEIVIGGVKVGSLPGLDLALRYHDLVKISGEDTTGKVREIGVRVVRPEAFVLIKAYPLERRKKSKDAYDIAFVLNKHEDLQRLAVKMAPIVETDSGGEAFALLQKHFSDLDAEGPRCVAEFADSIGQSGEQMRQAAFQDAQELFRCVSLARGEF